MKKNIIKTKLFTKSLICLIGILIFVLGIAVDRFMNANADDVSFDYLSNEIGYDSTNSSLNADNVKDAIDELYNKVGKCPKGYECFTDEEVNSSNVSQSNVLLAYKYDEDSNSNSYCITGEDDEKCKKTLCYLSKNKNSCLSGTIIDYKVNDTEIVRFHVLHDDGRSMTMQAQQSQVKGVAWHAGENVTENGPDAILPQLESKTSEWKYVNDIDYSGNNTKFIGVETLSNTPNNMKNNNNYCSSSDNSCTSNQYTYPTRTVKARMIMMQEVIDVGCTKTHSTCPKFMYNYLYDAMNYGATKNDNTEGNYGYWTMSTYSSSGAWHVYYDGIIHGNTTSGTHAGARAVVVVDK